MRSYWMSLSLVAGLLLGYTAIVFSSHPINGSKLERANVNPTEPREPATAASASQAAAVEASANVN